MRERNELQQLAQPQASWACIWLVVQVEGEEEKGRKEELGRGGIWPKGEEVKEKGLDFRFESDLDWIWI